MCGDILICYNLGDKAGFSERKVIDTANRITGEISPVHYNAHSEDDLSVLTADAHRAMHELSCLPETFSLVEVIKTT